MKRIFLPLLAALFLAPIFANAEAAFTLDRDAVYSGMSLSWNNGYAPQVQENVMTLHFPVRAPAGVDKISAEIIRSPGAPTPFSGQGLSGTFAKDQDDFIRVTLKPQVYRERVNGDYAFVLRVTGGGESADIPFTLHLREMNAKSPDEVPRPVIANLQCNLKVGEDAVLTATVANPGRYAALREMTLTISDPAGEILTKGSNILPLDDQMPGESREIAVPLTVKADASVTLHTLQLTFSYTALDADGTWEESFTLPVLQEMRVELGALTVPATVLQGGTANLSLPVMNLGRGKLVNVMARLTLPGITEGQAVLVGDIEPGGTVTAKMTFTPGKDVLGDISGSLTVLYEDAWGNAANRELPVAVTVEKAPEVSINLEESNAQENAWPGWLPTALMAGCGVLLLICILEAIFWSGKVRKLEEERL